MDPGGSPGQYDKTSLVSKARVSYCCMWVVTRHDIFNSPISVVNSYMDTDGMENNVLSRTELTFADLNDPKAADILY